MRVAVVGYASLDYVVRLDSPPHPDRTSTIQSRSAEWPRLGGSPVYVATALVAGGVADATPISWVGDDREGERYRASLGERGVSASGVGTRAGRTPICILAYQPDGRCHCLYDPGLDARPELDKSQRALIAAADAVCITVGPPSATREALALMGAEAPLAWVVKADPRAVPGDLAAALAMRADAILFSRGEANFVDKALSQAKTATRRPVVIETRGADAVAIRRDGRIDIVSVETVDTDDPTGAGDTFAGGFLAAWLSHGDPLAAAKAGAAAARALLAMRARSAEAAH
jgi:ribokinase